MLKNRKYHISYKYQLQNTSFEWNGDGEYIGSASSQSVDRTLRSWRDSLAGRNTHQFPLNSTFVAYTEEIVDEFSHNANKELI